MNAPCPFCGNRHVERSVVKRTQFGRTRYVVSIYCPYCHARGPREVYHKEEEKEEAYRRATGRWNARVGP